jgi:hypothetical protein
MRIAERMNLVGNKAEAAVIRGIIIMTTFAATAVCPILPNSYYGRDAFSPLFITRTDTHRSFYRFHISSGFRQGHFHFLNHDYLRIIINGIYLSQETKAFLDFLYAFQPYQGLLAHVISFNNKDHLRCSCLHCNRGPLSKKEKQSYKNKIHQGFDEPVNIIIHD